MPRLTEEEREAEGNMIKQALADRRNLEINRASNLTPEKLRNDLREQEYKLYNEAEETFSSRNRRLNDRIMYARTQQSRNQLIGERNRILEERRNLPPLRLFTRDEMIQNSRLEEQRRINQILREQERMRERQMRDEEKSMIGKDLFHTINRIGE